MKKLTLLLIAFLIPLSSFAQTATNLTTLSAAVTTANQTVFTLASVSGVTSPTATVPQFAYVDREQVRITNVNTTNNQITVIRGQNGTFATGHQSGEAIWTGGAGAFVDTQLTGRCSRTQSPGGFLPIIHSPTGLVGNCILSTTGTTSSWVWFDPNQRALAAPYKKLAVTATTYTALPNDEIIGYNTNVNGTITLCSCSGFVGKTYFVQIEVTGTQSLTIAAPGSETINGGASVVLGGSTSFTNALIYYDGVSKWFAKVASN